MMKKLSVALCVASAFGVGIAQAEGVSLTQTFTVDFFAQVKAGTCVFSVSSPGALLDAEGVLDVNLGTIRKDSATPGNLIPLNFNLTGCADALFDSVDIKGDQDSVIETAKGGNVVFYSDDAGNTKWSPSTEGIPVLKNDLGDQTNVEVKRWVRFEQDNDTGLGDHTARIVFTATYQ